MKYVLMLDSLLVERWMYDAISLLVDDDRFVLHKVIVRDKPKPSLLSKCINNRSFALFKIFNVFYLKKVCPSLEIVNLQPLLKSVSIQQVSPILKRNNRESIPSDVVMSIVNDEVDVIVRFGFGILSGDILKASKIGVLSYHHGDPSLYRGGPPLFWEYKNGTKKVGSILQILSEKLDGGSVVRFGEFSIDSSYSKTLEKMLKVSSFWLHDFLSVLSDGHSVSGIADHFEQSSKGKIYKLPTNSTFIIFLLIFLFKKFEYFLRKSFYFDLWAVRGGYADPRTNFFDLSQRNMRVIFSLPFMKGYHSFYADPCVMHNVIVGKNVEILAEYFDYKNGIGEIKKIKFLKSGFEGYSLNYDRSIGHLSFPRRVDGYSNCYTFENSASHGLLFGFLSGDKLTFERQVNGLEGYHLVDPSVVRFDGRWYLFSTLKELGVNDVLVCFTKSDIFSGECWQRHSPFIVSVSPQYSRLGGQITASDTGVFIPVQSCMNSYGESNSAIFVSPGFYPNLLQSFLINKSHTIDLEGGIFFCDEKMTIFSFKKPFILISKKLRSFLKRCLY